MTYLRKRKEKQVTHGLSAHLHCNSTKIRRMFKTLLLTLAIIAISFALLSITIIIKKNGKFSVSITPDTVLTEDKTLMVVGEYKALQKCFRI